MRSGLNRQGIFENAGDWLRTALFRQLYLLLLSRDKWNVLSNGGGGGLSDASDEKQISGTVTSSHRIVNDLLFPVARNLPFRLNYTESKIAIYYCIALYCFILSYIETTTLSSTGFTNCKLCVAIYCRTRFTGFCHYTRTSNPELQLAAWRANALQHWSIN